jgi:hypothetical protein
MKLSQVSMRIITRRTMCVMVALVPGSGWWVGNLHHREVVIVACYRA